MNRSIILGIIAFIGLAIPVIIIVLKNMHYAYADNLTGVIQVSRVIGILALALLFFFWLKKKK